jgi:hypothetical protein
MVTVELAHITVAKSDGIDAKHCAPRRGNGIGKVEDLPGTVTAEHGGADAHDRTSWEMIVFMISLVPP